MADPSNLLHNSIIITQKPINCAESTDSVEKSPFRRIEFHLARKPFTGFSNGGGDGSFRLETLNPSTVSSKNLSGNQTGLDGVGSGSSGKKRDASELENGLDPELSFGITFRRIGAGLENLGNTCFLNSVLQCLTYTEPLAAYLQSGKHQVTCKKAGFCALCAIQKHVSRALQSSGRSLAPKDLVSNLRCISRTFRNSRQEDAHEYMVNLLESMHKCCLPTGVPSESPSAYDRSLVHKIFGGRLRSQVKCMQCSYCSDKFDPFLDLSLEILKADTLYKAFANFTAKEQLDGGAKQYQCQQCKQKVKALKQLTIHKAPNVLTVHLKRFGSHMSGQKIDKKIQFGSTLDLKPFVTGPYDGDLKYTLYGVLVHAGWSTHSGHYYCFVRTSSGMWYSLDDNRVIQVSEKKVFEQKAYMLFYFRDRKNIPSKKPADVHQKDKMATVNGSSARNETQINTGLSKGSLNGRGFGPNAPKETQMNTSLSNGSLVARKSLANGFGAGTPNGTRMNTGLSNGSVDSRKALTTVSTERNGFSPDARNQTRVNTNGSLHSQESAARKSLANGSTERSGFGPGAPNQARVNTNGSLNGHVATVSTERSGFSPGAPNETRVNTNGSLNGQDSAAVGTMRNGFGIGAPDQTQKKEGLVPKTIQESHSESSKNGGLPLSTNGIGATKAENRDSTKGIGEKKHKKSKNFLKCKVLSMKISSNVLMGTSLNQRKKKKHKKPIKNRVQETVIDDGPSSSEKTEPREAVKPHVKSESKSRVDIDGAELATSRTEPKGPNHVDGSKGGSTQKDLVQMLTRGLDERIVPRWDDGDSTPSQIRETTRGHTIGYVGDEWDEEYDRGKRKKVRMSRTEFDGKNPFQDIANERLNSHTEKHGLSKRPTMTKFKKSRPLRV